MGGVMAKAADEGHRVVLVVATRGEHGEVDEGFLDAGRGAVAAPGARRPTPARPSSAWPGWSSWATSTRA